MTLLAQYYVPGLHVEDHAIDVPLDWSGKQPGEGFDGESIRLFYRVVTAPEHVHDDLPLLVFLQGGPGGEGPRPLSPSSDGWIEEAVKHFRVVLPDQRGTGRSNRVDGTVMRRIGDPAAQAAYLKHFLADSIVKDFEHLRRTVFCGRQWVTLGQSYGGFLTLTYLSFFPEGVTASFTCGGIPHVPANATEVYEHTFPRMARKTAQFYERYPQDAERAAAVADILAAGDVTLPNGDQLTVERFQMLGSDFGMKPSFERVHWILDQAFLDGDGSASKDSPLSEPFLASVAAATSSRPLYWPLQEFIYADGEMDEPIRWAAQRVRDTKPEFDPAARLLLFTGEAMFPWMFEKEAALRPFGPAMDLLMEDTSWGHIYDEDQLARNEVPLQSAVYFDDLYVDSGMQLDTLSRVGNSHYWTTNEFEHDGLHGSLVFKHLFDEALNRGDLEALY
ncbi:alpha/beta fold hydrolase [Bifidobacterium avesanii]|uniref:Alpha/beta fold hydrolase n=1 Tax=Bifidobacterium avesanii TaxID=1798157 RepID=A0A7K3TH53_9BIFI|nr:alpha/beta fold hydrolase [Bifidobacterium avesanii]KAB8292821.1 proline iminopeptidase [Bifidobacterium avesanii]NEG78425.1 alpha/beta fold hydrolase [Bifidobacterium avesanii]